MKRSLLLMAATVAAAITVSAGKPADFHTIPLPQSVTVEASDAPFTLGANPSIVAPGSLAKEAAMLRGWLPAGLKGKSSGVITLAADLADPNPEAYTIEVTATDITVNGASPAGTFYGLQTLRKAIATAEPSAGGTIAIPAGRVCDRPRFGYRGMHLDVARHFFPVADVRTYIDMMALHGMNTLHLHLTDDQGWRVEIQKYPRLAEVGSRRPGTIVGRTGPQTDSIPVEGFYTKDYIRDLVAYAADRHIQIIPEIDLPSHMLAALASYPELGCTGGPYEVWQRWGISRDVLCAGSDSALQFVDDVISEVADLFPAPYIHIGGDECPTTRWEECPRCQARIRELGIEPRDGVSAETLLQGCFTARACAAAARHGKKAIGWDEILGSDVPQDAVVMSWHGVTGAVEGTSRGHEVILTPSQYCYFDYFQSPDGPDEPFAVGGLTSVEHVYSLEPLLPSLTEEQRSLVLGCQANLWTEYIKTLDHVQYNTLPRMAALSEVQWTEPELKDYQDFRSRVINLMKVYDSEGYNYARHIRNVDVDFSYDVPATGRALVMTCSALPGYEIRYTLDGTEPGAASTLYTAPVPLAGDCRIRVNTFLDGRAMGREVDDSLHISPLTFGRCTIVDEPYYVYAFKGAPQLVDGLAGTRYFRTGRWLGFSKHDLDATIEMQEPATLSQVSFNVVVKPVDALADAAGAEVYGRPAGSREWRLLASESYPPDAPDAPHQVVTHTLAFDPVELDAVRVVVKPVMMLPPEHPQGGWPALLFVDEISAR